MENKSVAETDKKHRWAAWLYTLILVALAVVGVLYCSKLREKSELSEQEQIIASEEVKEVADEVLDLGGEDLRVPLSDVMGD